MTILQTFADPQSAERKLLQSLATEVAQFRKGQASYSVRTLALTPYGSDLFGITTVEEELYLGWPEAMFDTFSRVRWYGAAMVKGVNDRLFLILGIGNEAAPVALAIRLRPARLRLLQGRNELLVVPVSAQGEFDPLDPRQVALPINAVNSLAWEKTDEL